MTGCGRHVHLVEPKAVLHKPLHQRVVAVGAARGHALELEVHPGRYEGQRLRVSLRAARDAVRRGPQGAALPLASRSAGAWTAAGGERRRVDHGTNCKGPVGE